MVFTAFTGFTSAYHGNLLCKQVYMRISLYLVRNRFTSGCHDI